MPLVTTYSTSRRNALKNVLVSAPKTAWFLDQHFSCSARLCLLFDVTATISFTGSNHKRTCLTPNTIAFFVSIAVCGIVRLKRDGTRAEATFRLSPKRTSPFKSPGASVQSTAGCRGVRISVSNAGYTAFRGSVRVLATHSVRQFTLHFPSRASPCAIRFQTHSTRVTKQRCTSFRFPP